LICASLSAGPGLVAWSVARAHLMSGAREIASRLVPTSSRGGLNCFAVHNGSAPASFDEHVFGSVIEDEWALLFLEFPEVREAADPFLRWCAAWPVPPNCVPAPPDRCTRAALSVAWQRAQEERRTGMSMIEAMLLVGRCSFPGDEGSAAKDRLGQRFFALPDMCKTPATSLTTMAYGDYNRPVQRTQTTEIE